MAIEQYTFYFFLIRNYCWICLYLPSMSFFFLISLKSFSRKHRNLSFAFILADNLLFLSIRSLGELFFFFFFFFLHKFPRPFPPISYFFPSSDHSYKTHNKISSSTHSDPIDHNYSRSQPYLKLSPLKKHSPKKSDYQ